MTTQTTPVNGVNLEQLVGTVNLIKENWGIPLAVSG